MQDASDIDTLAVHGDRSATLIEGAVTFPIFQSSTFAHSGEGDYDAVRYTRLNNGPNHLHLHRTLAALAGAEDALVLGSGMAAISTALLSVARAGDHVLMQDNVYGGTHTLVTRDLARLGIAVDFVAGDDPDAWAAGLRDETRLFYVEAISNPLGRVPDLPAVVRFARAHGLVSMIDATFASPVNLRPLTLGFDLEVHSATKYLNGHSDVIAGCVMGRSASIAAIRSLANHLGSCLDPHACFLLARGIKTLPLRVRQQNANALALAEWLGGQAAVTAVYYPGLATHPVPEGTRGLFRGFGGVLAFEVRGGAEAADRLIAALDLAIHAPSLGGTETLVTRPATTSHAAMSPDERAAAGISDGLVRVACGIEAPGDLQRDFEQALRSVDG